LPAAWGTSLIWHDAGATRTESLCVTDSFRFRMQNLQPVFFTASPKTRRKLPPAIFEISSGVKPVLSRASTTTK